MHDRGVLSEQECIYRLLDLFAETSDDEAADAFKLVPDAMVNALLQELEKLANVDYFVRSSFVGDLRTEKEIHQSALDRQPRLRRSCQKVRPWVLRRAASM